jgi:hypothetical protein
MCSALGLLSFIEIPFGTDFKSVFMTRDDSIESTIIIVYSVIILLCPFIGYYGIKRNFITLNTKSTQKWLGVFYIDNKIDTLYRALYNIFFLRRRLITVAVLIFPTRWPFFQCIALMLMSILNLAYMLSA